MDGEKGRSQSLWAGPELEEQNQEKCRDWGGTPVGWGVESRAVLRILEHKCSS